MAARTVLLFLLVCVGERLSEGSSVAVSVSKQDAELLVASEKKSGETSISMVRIKELEDHSQNTEGEMRTASTVASELKEIGRNDVDFVTSAFAVRELVVAAHSKSTPYYQMPDPALQTIPTPGRGRNMVTSKIWVDVVNNGHSLRSSSHAKCTLRPEFHLEAGVDVLPDRAQGHSKWVVVTEDTGSGLHLLPAEPRSRRRRSWLWNQFFVIEEYRGPEPVLIGRVSRCHTSRQ